MSTPLFDYALGLADDALISAQRMGWWISRAPELEEDVALANIGLDQLGQARTLLDYAGARRGRRPQRGRPRLPPRRPRVPQRLAGRARRRPTSASPWPGCWSSRPTSRELYAALEPQRRPHAGRRRRQGGQGGRLPPRPRRPLGGPARRRHRRVPRPHAGGPRRGVAVRRRAVRRRLDAGARRARASPSTRPRCGRAVLDRIGTVVSEATLSVPDVAPATAAAAAACTPSTSATCSPRCSTCPLTPRSDLVMPPDPAPERGRWPRRSSTPSCPVVTIEDLGILRDVAEDEGARVHVQITPTYSGCPAMETIRTDLIDALCTARLRPRRRRVRAVPAVDH